MRSKIIIPFLASLMGISFFFPLEGEGALLVKKPNVSGQFYSAQASVLREEIKGFLAKAKPNLNKGDKIAILISPHAGYIYSGQVAAYGYKAIEGKNYRTVIILGPSHFYGFHGISVWPQGFFETPLGRMAVNEKIAKQFLKKGNIFQFIPQAFEKEHSIEVQIPFIQTVLPKANIVPLVIGQISFEDCQKLAQALYDIVGEREDIFVLVSTDFSHYHDYETARRIDLGTIQALQNRQAEALWDGCILRKTEMCGFMGAVAALIYANKEHFEGPKVLLYKNSGDVIGDKRRVVGYVSAVFLRSQKIKEKTKKKKENDFFDKSPIKKTEPLSGKKEGEGKVENETVPPLTLEQKRTLMEIAKKTIHQYITSGTIPQFHITDPRLQEKEGAFVTLKEYGRLRGCIGHIIGDQPLYQTVRDMAIAAATQDPRFRPVTKDELDKLEIEISVLSRPRRIKNIDEIQLGKHGVIVSQGLFHKGIFLPQVATETGWNKEEFLSNLCAHKAGLPADAWKDPKTVIEIFTADVFSESDIEQKKKDK